jgi:uncharacterized protein (TIGR02001 family)
VRVALGCLALLAAAPAEAQWTGTATLASEYHLTGVAISAEKPVVQGSVDYWHEAGIYAGIWSSSGIDFGGCCHESYELDLYAGWSRALGERVTLDLSLNDYRYPGAHGVGYTELGVELRYASGLQLRYNWSEDYLNTGVPGHYSEARYDGPVVRGFGWFVHVGHTGGPAFVPARIGISDYLDRSAGVSRGFGRMKAELAWIDTSLSGAFRIDRGVLANQGRWLFTLSSTFEL